MKFFATALCTGLAASALLASPAVAQDDEEGVRRTRVALGAQLVPSYPGIRRS
jgi:hypothetical protein